MDNQAQITETISRLDSEKVRERQVNWFDCYFSLNLAEIKKLVYCSSNFQFFSFSVFMS